MSARNLASQAQQMGLAGMNFKTQMAFGGTQMGKSNPKKARTVNSRQGLHIVLRSRYARGARSFLVRAREIEALLKDVGARTGVKVYRVANAGNHLHLLVKFLNRRALQRFLRAVTGIIARITLGAQKGSPSALKEGESFWDARPFTRIVAWGRDFDRVKNYLRLNRLEAQTGLARPEARKLLAAQPPNAQSPPPLVAMGFV